MATLKDNQIIIQDDDGNEHLVDILFTYENEERGRKYVFFISPENEEEVMVMAYTDDGELEELSDEEFEEAEEVLGAFEDETNSN